MSSVLSTLPFNPIAERMSRIHPRRSRNNDEELSTIASHPSVWTVWNKSSMGFQGTDGFTIYDSKGRLAFRVDNYSRKHKCFAGELLLMNGDGKPIMALRPQVYHESCFSLPLFNSHNMLRQKKTTKDVQNLQIERRAVKISHWISMIR